MRQNWHRAHEAKLFELADSLFILDAPSICCFFFKFFGFVRFYGATIRTLEMRRSDEFSRRLID